MPVIKALKSMKVAVVWGKNAKVGKIVFVSNAIVVVQFPNYRESFLRVDLKRIVSMTTVINGVMYRVV